ncbi:MAG: YhcH/YjgK/YiaL family protein [Eubacteriales bacterium]|nr:YhcH/YjgK/YiaL family protein [Eubacteriales bacterium]
MTNQERIDAAIAYLEKEDLLSKEVGKYIVNDDFYYLIQEYDSKDPSAAKLESHDNFADIQMVLKGKEAIDTIEVEGLKEKIPYNPEKDITVYEVPEEMLNHTVLTDGSYFVLLPGMAHRPGVRVGDTPVKINKCVGKVRVTK